MAAPESSNVEVVLKPGLPFGSHLYERFAVEVRRAHAKLLLMSERVLEVRLVS